MLLIASVYTRVFRNVIVTVTVASKKGATHKLGFELYKVL